MNRKLKVAGLALCVGFALSVAASPASAFQHHFVSDAPAEVTYAHVEAITNVVSRVTTSGEDHLVCTGVGGDGMIQGQESTEIATPPIIGIEQECTAVIGESELSAYFTPNECQGTFTGETTETVTPGEHATVHIDCPEGGYAQTDVTAFKLPCTTIPSQTLHGIHYKDEGAEIRVDATIHGIQTETLGACGEGVHDDGSFTGAFTVKGYADKEHLEQVELDLVETE